MADVKIRIITENQASAAIKQIENDLSGMSKSAASADKSFRKLGSEFNSHFMQGLSKGSASGKDFGNYLQDYWSRIKNNFEYLNFISSNARSWFLKNCTLNNNVNYVLSQIDLEQLYG
jgi:hypothetical protein